MNEFITAYPAIAVWLLGLMGAAVGGLFAGLLYVIKLSLDNLIRAIAKLELAIVTGQTDIGFLKDRMQKQETICNMHRALCPYTAYTKEKEQE